MFKSKLLLSAVIGLSSLLAVNVSHAADYEEGKHYSVISDKATNVDIKEYFSAYCPHCEKAEPYVVSARKRIRSTEKKEYSFERSHVSFLGGVPKSSQKFLTSSIILSDELGKQDEYVEFLFHKIHKENIRLVTPEDIQVVMTEFGFTEDQINNEMVSTRIMDKTSAFVKEQESLVREGKIKGVPSFVVKGKYLINLSGIDSSKFSEDLANLIVYLKEKG